MDRNKKEVFENPLVSIIVITYNSAKYVLETLESAKEQTYENIELIVSDDGSTDDTVEICRHWIEENKERFVRTEIITVEKNTGIPANCNRGVKAAMGEWVKLIAGDDVLWHSCLNDFIDYSINSNQNVDIVVGASIQFSTSLSIINLNRITYRDAFFNENINAYTQYQILLRKNRISAPATFIKRELLLKLKGFDERYPIEDYPLWLKITKSGIKIHGLAKPVVYYRIHSESAFSGMLMSNNNKNISSIFWKYYRFNKEMIYPNLGILGKMGFLQLLLKNRIFKSIDAFKTPLISKVINFIFSALSIKRIERYLNKRYYI